MLSDRWGSSHPPGCSGQWMNSANMSIKPMSILQWHKVDVPRLTGMIKFPRSLFPTVAAAICLQECCLGQKEELVERSHPLVILPKYRKKGHYSTRRSRGQRLLTWRGGFKGWVEEDREDTRGSGSNRIGGVTLLGSGTIVGYVLSNARIEHVECCRCVVQVIMAHVEPLRVGYYVA
ncbi:hypothetical protein AAG570_000925 [Ranatra chinensis]|uniref:Uncharacterized protein n=1 Tax=Ranatra chinensis TaxID=642074 RepID=A0ABD0ZLS3_9HEMI